MRATIAALLGALATVGGLSFVEARPWERAAREAYDYLKANRATNPLIYRNLVSRLDHRSARWAIAQYRESFSFGRGDPLALTVIVESGGPEAAEFLLERLSAPKPDFWVLYLVSGLDGWTPLRKIPLDSRFRRLAFRLLESNRERDRSAGAGLLGWNPSHRTVLETLFREDPDPRVRMVAARGLGRVGNESSRKMLSTWLKTGPEPSGFRHSVELAVRRLEARRDGRPDPEPQDQVVTSADSR